MNCHRTLTSTHLNPFLSAHANNSPTLSYKQQAVPVKCGSGTSENNSDCGDTKYSKTRAASFSGPSGNSFAVRFLSTSIKSTTATRAVLVDVANARDDGLCKL